MKWNVIFITQKVVQTTKVVYIHYETRDRLELADALKWLFG